MNSISRRQFLSGGFQTAAGLAVVGGMGGLVAACGGGSNAGGSGSSSGEVSGRTSTTPRRGGTLRVGVNSDFNSFAPPTGQFDANGLMYAATVFDALMFIDANGDAQPYLCQSMTPNAEQNVFTMTLRPGVVFHDGTPLTSAEVVGAIRAVQQAVLTGPALLNLDTVKAQDAMTVVFTTKTPWPAFPLYLTGQLGYIASPKTLSDPKGGLHPVGTGPFVFDAWVPGSYFHAKANPNYWRKGLPYVDRVEYSTIPSVVSLEQSLLAGTIDVMTSGDSINLHDLMGNSSVQYVTDADSHLGEPNMGMTMCNTEAAPVSDLRVRQAMAYGFNIDLYQKVHNFGLYPPAYGLFPGNPDYAKTNAMYPRYDQARAKALVQDYEKDKGPLKIEYATTSDPRNAETAQFLQQQYKDIGIDVTIKTVEQVQLITDALLGQYQTTAWAQFAAPTPDSNYVWWSIPTSAPIGQSSLNFARNKDPLVQAALEKGRTSLNKADRIAAYNTVNERFAKDLPYLFGYKIVTACYTRKNVQNFNGLNLPDGSPALSFTSGIFYPMCTWLSA
ncbi:MAG TPA: ABC transporter substrate-binding protein [Mycobacteriales bacterium]